MSKGAKIVFIPGNPSISHQANRVTQFNNFIFYVILFYSLSIAESDFNFVNVTSS